MYNFSSLTYTILMLLLIGTGFWNLITEIDKLLFQQDFRSDLDLTVGFHFCAAGEKVFFLFQVFKTRRRIRDEEHPKQVWIVSVGVLFSSKVLKMRGSKKTNHSSGWHCALIKELKATHGDGWVCMCVCEVFFPGWMVKNTTFIFPLRMQRL